MSKANNSQQAEEVDLGQLFSIIGNGFNRLFKFIGGVFNHFFLAFVWIILFIKKRIVILSIAGFIGLVIGVALDMALPPIYKSTLSIKQNYETGENLYQSINYYNGLLKDKDYKILGELLGVTETATKEIVGFDIEPIITDNEYLVMFNNYIANLDSLAASKIEYKEYKNNIREYKHLYQQISIKSKTRPDFKGVFSNIINNIETNPFFVNEQAKDIFELQETKQAIEISLVQSDSLQQTYKRVLESSKDPKSNAEIGITFEGTNESEKTKEFELYINDIELRQKIVKIQRELKDKENIIDMISSKQDNGFEDDTKELLGVHIPIKFFYLVILFGLTFIALLIPELIRFFERIKDQNAKG
tara:strand:+ start:267 stop:1346 length:1080 start_codon:yes stop_codon:yes gene_type:complete